MNRFRAIAKQLPCMLMVIACLLSSSLRADELAGDASVTESHPLLQKLASSSFEERSAASEELKTLDVKVVADLARLLPAHHSVETATRLLSELETRFISDDLDQQFASSEALETLADDERLSISEAARRSLKLHWQRRIDIAIRLLKSKGATVKRGHFTPGTTFGWIPGNGPETTIQMMLGERWKGGEDDIRILQRLAPLLGPVRGRNGLTLFLLDGHPLSDESVVLLKDIVGTNRVIERSRVALGIKGDHIHRENVLIGEISPGGSADAAGLKEGDLIEAIVNPETEEATGKEKEDLQKAEVLRDFDDLVQRLRAYREGDVVTLRVIRTYQQQLSRYLVNFRVEFDKLIDALQSGELSEDEQKAKVEDFRGKLARNQRTLSLFDSLIARLRNEPSQFLGLDPAQIIPYVRREMAPGAIPELKRELVAVELFGWEKLEAR